MTGVTFAFLSKRIPRRTQYLIAFGGMTAVFAVWTGVSANYAQTGNHQAAAAVVAMIFIYYMFYTIMHPLTYIFITEVFPFVHRAKGVGLTQTFSRAGSAFNLFVNPIGLGNIGWKFYLVYVVRLGPIFLWRCDSGILTLGIGLACHRDDYHLLCVSGNPGTHPRGAGRP